MKIELKNVSLDLPVYGTATRSIRSEIQNKLLGKRRSEDPHEKVVSVLNGVSLSLQKGDRIGLLGQNGAGKSSLLRLLGEIYWPTRGEIEISGTTRCLFGLNPGIQEEANGFENIAVLSRMLGFPKSELDRIEEDVVGFSELGNALYRPIRTFSNGMRLRLCFGVITAWPADILLIDEVIGVGDRDFKEKAKNRMKDFIFQSGILVMASHDPELVASYCTETIRMEKGRVTDRAIVEPAT